MHSKILALVIFLIITIILIGKGRELHISANQCQLSDPQALGANSIPRLVTEVSLFLSLSLSVPEMVPDPGKTVWEVNPEKGI